MHSVYIYICVCVNGLSILSFKLPSRQFSIFCARRKVFLENFTRTNPPQNAANGIKEWQAYPI